jgi:hypothetical protein
MATAPKNHGKNWSTEDLSKLKKMAPTRPVGIMAYELGRTEDSIRAKAHQQNISLNPPERSPYGRPNKKK